MIGGATILNDYDSLDWRFGWWILPDWGVLNFFPESGKLFSQIVTDTPIYFDATIHFPSELNAKVLTRDASQSKSIYRK